MFLIGFLFNYHKYIALQRNRFILCVVVFVCKPHKTFNWMEWITVCNIYVNTKNIIFLAKFAFKMPLKRRLRIEMCRNEYRINYNVLFCIYIINARYISPFYMTFNRYTAVDHLVIKIAAVLLVVNDVTHRGQSY